MPSLNDSVCICLILLYLFGLCAIVLLLVDKFIIYFIPHALEQYRTLSLLLSFMFLTENLATLILFVSYIFAMLVFLMLLIEKTVESLFH